MSGNHVTFFGDAMSAVAHGIIEIRSLLHRPPVIVGGLAVLSRLSNPYRATVDLDLVDRLHDATPHPEILRAASGAQPVEPAAVLLPTTYGPVKVDVLEVRQIELDHPATTPATDSTPPHTPGPTTPPPTYASKSSATPATTSTSPPPSPNLDH
ncbi:hypothetical protein ACLBYD_30230 [Rhodococcus sp. C26F]